MTNISTSVELKAAILKLECERSAKGKLLKEDIKDAYERLRPLKVFRNTLSEMFLGPDIISKLITAGVGLSSGYMSKRLVVGTSHTIMKKIAGNLIQIGVTKLMMSKRNVIQSLGQRISNLFGRKKVADAEFN